jgi:C1A family cysteine protease
MRHTYGWKPQLPDFRDLQFTAPADLVLPHWIDERASSGCGPIYDQGQLGSCTANAGVGAINRLQRKEGVPHTWLSRLDLYYRERVIEGTVNQDSGATIRDTMKAAAQGVCLETVWPYNINTFANPPLAEAPATKYALKSYLAVADLSAMKQSLALGFPVVFGISVYESFESASANATGMIPMPKKSEHLLGGHAPLAVGYRDSIQCVIFANSWGQSWGEKGYGYIPYAYLDDVNLAGDFWSPRLF